MYRHNTPSLLRFDPFLEWRISPSIHPTIYLTFDDGPHPEITPWVLDMLAMHHAKSTFFCVGENVLKHPGVYARILNEGHRVGNHTHNHVNGWVSETSNYIRNVQVAEKNIASDLFRPPYGKVLPFQALKLKKWGFRIIMWSVLSRDFEKNLDPKKALESIIQHSKNGSIVLFHDSEKAWGNLEKLLPAYLKHFSELGYQFKAL